MTNDKKVYTLAPINYRTKLKEDHHLYNNRGTYWVSLTFHGEDGTSERKRISLKTKIFQKAVRRRDMIILSLTGRKVTL